MQKMTRTEALQIIDQAVSQLQATRGMHIQLQIALDVLAMESNGEEDSSEQKNGETTL